jgi:heterodisulfide reductase subunit C2
MNDLSFLKEIERESGEKVSACYQCYRCTNSCPVLTDMDILPHRVIRYCVLGEKEKVLHSRTIWSCLQCYTCSVRCPNDIHVGHVFDTLRKIAVREEKVQDDVWKFGDLFLKSVERHGRVHEIESVLPFVLRKENFLAYASMGPKTVLKGRMGLFPHNIKDKKGIKKIFERVAAERKPKE